MTRSEVAAGSAANSGVSGRFLLDTHAFLWLATDDSRLGHRAREVALEPTNDLYLSLASVWEMAIKRSLGRLELGAPLEHFVEAQCQALSTRLLPIELAHTAAVEDLDFHHRDPFDRLLVVQARLETLTLVSRDVALDDYGITRVWT